MSMTINRPAGYGQEDNQIQQNAAQSAAQKKQAKNAAASGRKNFFAGDTLLGAQDPIERRRALAQKKAWKIVQDAWGNEQKVDRSVQERRSHYEEHSKLRDAANQELKDIGQQKAALKEQYGVADDSEEQKDLELLEKYQNYTNMVSDDAPTGEEYKRLAEISKQPLTDYQKRALALNGYAIKSKIDMQEASKQMREDVFELRSIAIERLKSHPMADAEKTADSIMAAANKEIMGMLIKEGTDHIEDEAEEAKEKAEENAEEKEEKEEYLEALEEKKAIQEAMIEKTQEAVDKAKAVQREHDAPEIELEEMVGITSSTGDMSKGVSESLEEIKNSMKLLEADLKGIQVDEEI